MKFLFQFLILTVVFSACNRTSKEAIEETSKASNSANGAAISFKEISFDFGEINEGDIVEHDFVFTNTGTSPLEIVDVRVQCGCTVASRPEKAIGVGQSDKITVSFNSTGKPGINNKYVTVITNAEKQPEPILFKAMVNQAIAAE